MTTEHIEGILIGTVIGFIIAVILYMLLKSLEYNPQQHLSDIKMKKIPPPPFEPQFTSRGPRYEYIDSGLKASPKCSGPFVLAEKMKNGEIIESKFTTQNPESESHIN